MASRVLLAMPELTLGEFACERGDRLWDEVNDIGGSPHVVFPRTRVLIEQDGAHPVLVTPNDVVYYRSHQRYRRGLRDARGDRSLWLEVAPELFERAPTGPARPSGAQTYLLAVGVANHLGREPEPDRLLAEEAALRLLGDAVDATARTDPARRVRTRAEHADLAEAAKELLTERMTQRLSLRELAAALFVSPFHLARVFRAQTGFSLLGYAVASAGDQDGDGHADVLVGAIGVNGGAGAAYVYSGRTYRLLRRIDGDAGDGFGSATDWTRSLDRDRRPDLIVGAFTEPGAHVFSSLGGELFSLAPPPAPGAFANFFVAGVGRVDGDRIPDLYAADYAAGGGAGYAGVYSGRDGSVIHQWFGGPGDGTGPGREAGDVDHDGRVDLAVGSYTASDAVAGGGRVDVHSGRTGRILRTITSTTPGENLGFDTVGLGDVNRDGEPDLLVSAATGSSVYLIAGTDPR